MPASEAQIRANLANSAKSFGPKSTAGKLASRANSYKHGLTGTGAVMSELEEAEVQRRTESFYEQVQPPGDIGVALIRHTARMSVRMERCAAHENALTTLRIRKTLDEFEVPEGLSELEIAKLREEVTDRVLFDTSKEAILLRKYAAAAERSFFRGVKELRLLVKEAKAAREVKTDQIMASILSGGSPDDAFEKMYADATKKTRRQPAARVDLDDLMDLKGGVDVPISVGKRPKD
jgi:hypothetical protein